MKCIYKIIKLCISLQHEWGIGFLCAQLICVRICGMCFKYICFSCYTNIFLYFIFFFYGSLYYCLLFETLKCERSISQGPSLGDQDRASYILSFSAAGTPLTSKLEMLKNSVLCFIEAIKQHCSCWTLSIISREAML